MSLSEQHIFERQRLCSNHQCLRKWGTERSRKGLRDIKSFNWIKSPNAWIDWLRFTESVSICLPSLASSTPALHYDKTGIYTVIYQTVYSCGDTSTFKTITSTNEQAVLSLRAIIRSEWVCSNQSDGALKRELEHSQAMIYFQS